jgi:hypothetical protein
MGLRKEFTSFKTLLEAHVDFAEIASWSPRAKRLLEERLHLLRRRCHRRCGRIDTSPGRELSLQCRHYVGFNGAEPGAGLVLVRLREFNQTSFENSRDTRSSTTALALPTRHDSFAPLLDTANEPAPKRPCGVQEYVRLETRGLQCVTRFSIALAIRWADFAEVFTQSLQGDALRSISRAARRCGLNRSVGAQSHSHRFKDRDHSDPLFEELMVVGGCRP